MKIYTKFGDKGKTSLFGGKKVDKYHSRICAYGALDELNAFVGLLYLHAPKDCKDFLHHIQNQLFVLGAELATPEDHLYKEDGSSKIGKLIEQEDVIRFEKEIDEMDKELPPLRNFILPGGSLAACYAHVCRTVCRRAERELVKLQSEEKVREVCLRYLNRLSDYFFVLARWLNIQENHPEILWNNE